uniref:Secreted protein n=1 Tax=Steinernema glaseri TaxID=37863 RepID=A0A1I7Z5Y7_9BILA
MMGEVLLGRPKTDCRAMPKANTGERMSPVHLKSTLLTIFTSLAQLMALIWFVLSYVPGGERGLRFITTLFGGVVKGRSTLVLPI